MSRKRNDLLLAQRPLPPLVWMRDPRRKEGTMLRTATHLPTGLLLAFLPGLATAAPAPGTDAIRTETVAENVRFLASDELQGRGSGAEGGRRAGDWLAAQCAALGLVPAGEDGGYFQPFSGQGKSMRNVVATIPGREDGEMVVIGAHYDHLGLGYQMGSLAFGKGRGKIHNGADDNASGTAAILEVARAFAKSGARPRRRVVFVWFDGEERGLLGSRYFVAHLPFASRPVLMINLDMVGKLKGNRLTVWGATTGGETLTRWLKMAGAWAELSLDLKDSLTSNSDHAPFYGAKIPVVVPFTGLHPDYHRPSDDSDKLNMEGIAKVARFSYGLAYQAANEDERPVYAEARDGTMEAMLEQLRAMFLDGKRLPRGLEGLFDGEGNPLERLKEFFSRRGGRRARLGVTIDTREGVRVASVVPGSVAERAGLQAGDRILSFGEKHVADFGDLRRRVAEAQGEVAIVVERDGARKILTARFPGAPVDEPPVYEPPVDEPPVYEPPVDEPPVDEPPVDEPPVDEPPVDE
ncbi:MAG: M20/M25/M40 family metallo-hydrolase, partial [Planctomycetota bacterium]